ncbi:MAG: hypothetical protein HQL65_16150 [Magnetococcales bacterium]|nr:hypothetical protein [Magnetococcales bacterium]
MALQEVVGQTSLALDAEIVRLVGELGRALQINEARTIYEALSALATAHPDAPTLREEQAKGAVNLINAYGNAGQIDAARALYKDLLALASAHPDAPTLRDAQAKGAVILTKLSRLNYPWNLFVAKICQGNIIDGWNTRLHYCFHGHRVG